MFEKPLFVNMEGIRFMKELKRDKLKRCSLGHLFCLIVQAR